MAKWWGRLHGIEKDSRYYQGNCPWRCGRELVEMRVKGISVTRVKGYGEYATFINPDWIFTHARIEIYTEQSMVDVIIETILDTAHTGMPGDGIVAVHTVERLYRIRNKAEIVALEI